ncbi:MAG: hypothetical protein KatS3mg105_1275 [Gemmatales bacterium]|nr:MAG: hypothetical protein KatS3mg105_1275 [Gemmatales bacterium]
MASQLSPARHDPIDAPLYIPSAKVDSPVAVKDSNERFRARSGEQRRIDPFPSNGAG